MCLYTNQLTDGVGRRSELIIFRVKNLKNFISASNPLLWEAGQWIISWNEAINIIMIKIHLKSSFDPISYFIASFEDINTHLDFSFNLQDFQETLHNHENHYRNRSDKIND